MKFCKISEVFAVNDEFKIEKIENDIIIIDNLFKDWQKVREFFLQQPWPMWKEVENTKNGTEYLEAKQDLTSSYLQAYNSVMSKVIKLIYNTETRHLGDTIRSLIFKQLIPNKCEFGRIHADDTSGKDAFTVLTYLNTEEECSGGTAFFPNIREPEGHGGRNFWSSNHDEESKICIKINMKPGQTIVYRTNLTHAPWVPENKWYDNPRITIISRFGTKEYIERLKKEGRSLGG